jgi:hypothetical protein
MIVITLLIYVFIPFIFYDYLAELTAAFVGVLIAFNLAFNLETYTESQKNKRDRKDLLLSLRGELERIEGTPINEEIYPDIWDSAISSGKLGLLVSSQLIKLTGIYRRIRELNKERQRVNQYREDYETSTSGRGVTRKDLYERWKGWELTHKTNTYNLKQKIEKIIQDKELWEG